MDRELISRQAAELDEADGLRSFRNQFHIPADGEGRQQVYLVGNSLGLQPGLAAEYVIEELRQWQILGVRAHYSGQHPWMPYHEFLAPPMAAIVGADETEVVMMNSLTTNLHLMMATFFRPTGKRTRILIESHAFPSDHIAVESHLKWHGLDPAENLLLLKPESASGLLSMEYVESIIVENRDRLGLVLLPGVQYYTGQVFDMPRITEVCREHQIPVGFDLAHAAGNIELHLGKWSPDFAVWCSYKYLNSGPGSVAGCFVPRRHVTNRELNRLAGWWGHDKSTRFQMRPEFHPIATAEGWQLSNPPILSMAAIRGSLEVFSQATMPALLAKSRKLTGWMATLIDEHLAGKVRVLTGQERGCQLSLQIAGNGAPGTSPGRSVKERLDAAGIETDWREPDVIRAAPVPLYNSFGDVARFVCTLEEVTR